MRSISGGYLEFDNVCLRTHEPTPLVLFHTDGDEGGTGGDEGG